MLGLFARKAPETPAPRIEPTFANGGFTNADSSNLSAMQSIFDLSPTAAGVNVTPNVAMQVSAVYACVRLIAGAIASLPLPIYRRNEDGRERFEHDYWWLLNEQPCPAFTAHAMWEWVIGHVLLRGDGLCYLYRGPGGRSPVVQQIIPLKREQVSIYRHGVRKERLGYRVHGDVDGTVGFFEVDQDDMLHFPNVGFDGVCSPSVIGLAARQAIGTAFQADQFAGKFYGAGAHVQYAIKAPKTMTPTQQDDFRQAFVAAYGSGQGPTGRPLILTEGLDIEQMSMTAVDAQLLEARRFQVVDIARAFGCPPHMIGETSASTSWGSGIEQMGIGFVTYTLRPHLSRFEDELNRKLWPRSLRAFCEFNVAGLMQGDSKAEAEYLSKALGGPGTQGWMVVNEARRVKNLPPIEGGDKLVFAGAAAPTPPAPPAKEPPEEEPNA